MRNQERRRVKLVKPELQFRWALMIGIATGVGVLTQALILVFSWARISTALPNDGQVLMAALPGFLGLQLLLTTAVLAPLLVILAILMTFRIAGPIHRMEGFLRSTIAGESPPDCRLREKDHLHELCGLINEATREKRGQAADTEQRAA